MSVRFRSFWPGFDPQDFFAPLLEGAIGDVVTVVDPGQRAEVIVTSVFASQEPADRRRRRSPWARTRTPPRPSLRDPVRPPLRIWYSGENQRPPIDGWDLAWGFEPDSPAAGVSYLPLWFHLFPELLAPITRHRSSQNRLGRELTLAEVTRPRASTTAGRPRFACLFTSHRDPFRMRLAAALSELGQVDVFGLPGTEPVATKLEVAREYRFMLCPENDLYPGYVTEKAFDAWGAGCVPVWAGLDRDRYLEPAAFVDAAARPLEEVVADVARLEADRARLDEMSRRPLLRRLPSLDAIRAVVAERLGASTQQAQPTPDPTEVNCSNEIAPPEEVPSPDSAWAT